MFNFLKILFHWVLIYQWHVLILIVWGGIIENFQWNGLKESKKKRGRNNSFGTFSPRPDSQTIWICLSKSELFVRLNIWEKSHLPLKNSRMFNTSSKESLNIQFSKYIIFPFVCFYNNSIKILANLSQMFENNTGISLYRKKTKKFAQTTETATIFYNQ